LARHPAGKKDEVPFYVLRPRIPQGRLSNWRRLVVATVALCACTASSWAAGQNTFVTKPDALTNPLSGPPRSWIVDVVANELVALHHRNSFLRYRMHVIDAKGDQIRDVIESKDGTVARLILKDGRPLTEDEDKAERERLTDMVASPSAYAKHVKNDGEGRKLADQLMRLMPDSMIYSYAPGQPQTGKNVGLQIVIDYEPNPKFSPPITAAEALTGLKGRLWIDAKSRQLVRMEGTIFRAVNFGWGMLAHIYPGGHLVLDQTNAGGSRWIFTRFVEDVNVRALMVKTIHIHTNVEASSFQTLPGPISYQDAIRMLLDTPLPTK
jgi:hypothetical protein